MKPFNRQAALEILFTFVSGIAICPSTASAHVMTDVKTTRAACAAGKAFACDDLVREETYRGAKTQLKVFLKSECERKNLAACSTRARVLQGEGRFTEALAVLEATCDGEKNPGEACIDLATALGANGKKDAELSMKTAACEHGSARACTAVAALIASTKPDKARQLNEAACAKGYSPACFNAHAPEKERVAHRLECEAGDLFACAGLASALPGSDEQLRSYQSLCDRHVEVACKLLGHLASELGREKDADRAVAELKKILFKRCEQGEGDACRALATIFDGTKESKRQLYAAKAAKILRKGCDQGDGSACAELDIPAMRLAAKPDAKLSGKRIGQPIGRPDAKPASKPLEELLAAHANANEPSRSPTDRASALTADAGGGVAPISPILLPPAVSTEPTQEKEIQ